MREPLRHLRPQRGRETLAEETEVADALGADVLRRDAAHLARGTGVESMDSLVKELDSKGMLAVLRADMYSSSVNESDSIGVVMAAYSARTASPPSPTR